ncbi:5'-3' exoribonuclease, putative [Entamoeba dispar SAW760]|uniref:5'-3' exoribonuclease n=1 Tax=Entamoeba dispar (strain ATCC PRA-260 / SAW760) TaxID=370354 RepID=B0EDU2_ENTDS|nr:5'-3' exoribonuclease, putative [Entamoeba dispar SAW760]EDR27303.1 5'-3' exoribonuclease, putative [Entamoeba dispar SAW760]|eukprot:EDR27303.1 5'-3' exoribonuclease, putative [Entamoeba dispar SAW760]
MGVPSFFRWLKQRFPKIIDDCQPSSQEKYGDLNEPNTNGVEYDNFYIDMNGLIHPCLHPQDRQAAESVEDMMVLLTRYLDYLIDIVRPRKLLYLAVDGVAPRAKMNQQRSRRFKSAKDAENAELKQAEENRNRAKNGLPEIPYVRPFDSNCITPGTEFMSVVSKTLKKYIKERMSQSSYWNKLVVILSDSGVPGEGEHKIMDFIRRQKESPDYNPNIHHCMYGLDADLIMLSLATHERFFSIVREKVFFEQDQCYICNKIHPPDKCPHRKEVGALDTIIKPFQFLHCHILRGYLQITLKVEGFEFERCVDDFIFFCFLVGNDFLPRIPSLDIRDGGVDLLMKVYREFLPHGGYITESGSLNVTNAKNFLREVGKEEPAILEKKYQKEKMNAKKNFDNQMKQLESRKASIYENSTLKSTESINSLTPEQQEQLKIQEAEIKSIEQRENRLKERFKKAEEKDLLKMGESGYTQRYYNVKFKINPKKDTQKVRDIVHSYFEGMNWVLGYYYKGCQSWDWYYPYLYAPFAEDMGEYVDYNFEFKYKKSIPFRPFEQLMSVLPPRSKSCLPEQFHDLMKSKGSPISEFYPDTFKLDFNGEKVDYKAIVVLTFIDQEKLLHYVKPIEKKLKGDAKRRNRRYGDSYIFIGKDNVKYFTTIQTFKTACSSIWGLIKPTIDKLNKKDKKVPLSDYKELLTPIVNSQQGLSGFIIPVDDMELSEDQNQCFIAGFINPQFEEGHVFKTRYLDGEPITLPEISVRGFSNTKQSSTYQSKRRSNGGDSYIDERKRELKDDYQQKRKNKFSSNPSYQQRSFKQDHLFPRRRDQRHHSFGYNNHRQQGQFDKSRHSHNYRFKKEGRRDYDDYE